MLHLPEHEIIPFDRTQQKMPTSLSGRRYRHEMCSHQSNSKHKEAVLRSGCSNYEDMVVSLSSVEPDMQLRKGPLAGGFIVGLSIKMYPYN